MRKFDLEKRLVRFSVQLTKFCDQIPSNQAGQNLTKQLVRSSTSAALNYGEAQGAESRKDFIHKMRITLKELRETSVCLQIIEGTSLYEESKSLINLKNESKELIAIFVSSIQTAKSNFAKK